MTEPITLRIVLPPGLSARIAAHAAQWGSSPEATAIYCLMARFPAPSIIEAVGECASTFRSRDAHAPFERADGQRRGEAGMSAEDLP